MTRLKRKAVLYYCGTLVAIFSLITLLLYQFIETDPYQAKMALFHQQSHQIEAITVGSSHARAIHFSTLGLNGMHFFGAGSDSFEAINRAKCFAPLINRLKVVFIVVSPGVFSFDRNDSLSRELRIFRESFWSCHHNDDLLKSLHINLRLIFLDFYERIRNNIIEELSLLSFSKKIKTIRTLNQNVTQGDKCMLLPNVNTPMEDGLLNGYPKFSSSPDCLIVHANKTAKGHDISISKNHNDTEEIFHSIKNKLFVFSDEMAKRDVKVVVFGAPLTQEYFDHPFIKPYQAQYYKNLEILQQHPNITFIDLHRFYFDSGYREHNRVFFDDDHVNLTGAKIASKALKQELIKQGIL